MTLSHNEQNISIDHSDHNRTHKDRDMTVNSQYASTQYWEQRYQQQLIPPFNEQYSHTLTHTTHDKNNENDNDIHPHVTHHTNNTRTFLHQQSKPYTYDWYVDWYHGIRELLVERTHTLHTDSHVLHIGCGNSKLPVMMYHDGYLYHRCIDISHTVIQYMYATYHTTTPHIEWIQDDAMYMSHTPSSEQYDIIIEKGTFDGILSGGYTESAVHSIQCIMKQCYRLLKENGNLFIFTHTLPEQHHEFMSLLVPSHDDIQDDDDVDNKFTVTIHKLLYSPTALLMNRLQRHMQDCTGNDDSHADLINSSSSDYTSSSFAEAIYDVKRVLSSDVNELPANDFCYVFQCSKSR